VKSVTLSVAGPFGEAIKRFTIIRRCGNALCEYAKAGATSYVSPEINFLKKEIQRMKAFRVRRVQRAEVKNSRRGRVRHHLWTPGPSAKTGGQSKESTDLLKHSASANLLGICPSKRRTSQSASRL